MSTEQSATQATLILIQSVNDTNDISKSVDVLLNMIITIGEKTVTFLRWSMQAAAQYNVFSV